MNACKSAVVNLVMQHHHPGLQPVLEEFFEEFGSATEGSLNELATQHANWPKEILVLMEDGLQSYFKLRPIDWPTRSLCISDCSQRSRNRLSGSMSPCD